MRFQVSLFHQKSHQVHDGQLLLLACSNFSYAHHEPQLRYLIPWYTGNVILRRLCILLTFVLVELSIPHRNQRFRSICKTFGVYPPPELASFILRLLYPHWHVSLQSVSFIWIKYQRREISAGPFTGWWTDRWGSEWITVLCILLSIPWMVTLTLEKSLGLFIASFALQSTISHQALLGHHL